MPDNPRDYDKMAPPKGGNEPTTVFFHVTVMSLDSIDESSMVSRALKFYVLGRVAFGKVALSPADGESNSSDLSFVSIKFSSFLAIYEGQKIYSNLQMLHIVRKVLSYFKYSLILM